jgi:Insertion element 4 transposase N-terminal
LRVQSAIAAAVTTITTTITVAAGVFAPGHLGELTWQVPFELADAVLEDTRARERRLRVLPSRVGIYFVLALGLFPGLGYGGVWEKLTAALDGQGLCSPSAKALRDLRRRIGTAPVKALFEVLAGPVAQPHTPGVRFGRYRTVAFDGCTSIKVPDTGRNRSWLGKMKAAKCSDEPIENACRRLPPTSNEARCAAVRSVTRRPPRNEYPGSSSTPATDARVPALVAFRMFPRTK